LSFETGIPIVPVAIRNSRYCLGSGSPMILRPGLVSTEAGVIFKPGDFSDALSLQKSVYQWFEQKNIEMPKV
jgi:hypothetical protein